MNAFNEYGYDESINTITIPEETRTKWREWKKETRDWREHIENHIDEKHDETQNHVTSETNRAINDIKATITASRDYVVDNVNSKANEIKTKIDSSRTVIDNIWNKVRNL